MYTHTHTHTHTHTNPQKKNPPIPNWQESLNYLKWRKGLEISRRKKKKHLSKQETCINAATSWYRSTEILQGPQGIKKNRQALQTGPGSETPGKAGGDSDCSTPHVADRNRPEVGPRIMMGMLLPVPWSSLEQHPTFYKRRNHDPSELDPRACDSGWHILLVPCSTAAEQRPIVTFISRKKSGLP